MRLHDSSLQQGQGLVEYALILVLIALAVILGVTLLGDSINQTFGTIVLQLQYPGVYSGDPVSVTGVNPSVTVSCVGADCEVSASASVGLSGASGSPVVCVRFSNSSGGSQLVCDVNPTATIGGGASGTVNACVIGVQGYSLPGGSVCQSTSY